MAPATPSTAGAPRRAGLAGVLGAFRRDRNGSTAVEFALVILPFIALLFAIIETALVFFSAQTLDTAVSRTARLIKTGQAQQAKMSANDFKVSICAKVALPDCATKLVVDVSKFASFGAISLPSPIKIDGTLDDDTVYQPGNGGDIVVVRAFYEWPISVKLLGVDLANLANGSRLLTAATAFRNEPFPW